MQDKIERKRLAILKVLKEADGALSSQEIAGRLAEAGYEISERTARFHLLAMDKQGLTEYIGKHGRKITSLGLEEITNARAHESVGFLASKIDQMAYTMDFDLERVAGTVIVNVSLLKRSDLVAACPLMSRVYEKGFSMGRLIGFFEPGERIGETSVPEGYIGVGTVCSITLNGVLLSQKIPVSSRFGGLLEVRQGGPVRFVAIINYDGTSLDPLEIFIKSGMTDYLGATGDGNGLIGAGFREMPAGTRDHIQNVASRLEAIGLGGFMSIGLPSQDLSEIRVSEGNVGAIVIGGLNPIAILEEAGFDVQSRALSGYVEYDRLFDYSELGDRAWSLVSKHPK